MTGTANPTAVTVSPVSSTTYTVSVGNVGNAGTVVAVVNPGAAADPAGNANVASGDFAMDLFEEINIDAAFAFRRAQGFALAAAQVPGLVAADVEARAGEVRQQFIEQFAQKGERAGMIRSEGGRIAQERSALAFVGLLDLGEFLQRRIFEPVTQMSERVLVRHKINAEFAAASVELQNLVTRERPPAAPDGFVISVGERVLGVKLEVIDLQLGQLIDQRQERGRGRHLVTRNIEHDAAGDHSFDSSGCPPDGQLAGAALQPVSPDPAGRGAIAAAAGDGRSGRRTT